MKVHDTNCETGEITIREMTEEEEADLFKQEAKSIDEQKQEKQATKTRGTLLERLGLTADEAKILIG